MAEARELPRREDSQRAVQESHVPVGLHGVGDARRVVRPELPDRVDLRERAESAVTPPTMNKNPVVLAMKTGNIGEPTTFSSVLPLPGNWVCFCRTSKKRCAPTSPRMMSGTIRTCRMKNLGITAVPGKLPPKTQNAR